MSRKGRPKHADLSLKELLAFIQQAAIIDGNSSVKDTKNLPKLSDRLKELLGIVNPSTLKANEMYYLVMYDIEDNKVRKEIAKYLIRKGCIRIQKSVYLAKTENAIFKEICEDLKEVQEAYENEDSIILAPVNSQTLGSMKVYGKNLQIEIMTDNPNTLFF